MAVVVVWSVEPLSFVVLFGLSPTCAAGLVRLGQWIPSEFSSQGVSTGELGVPDLQRIPLRYSSSSCRPSESPASVPLVRKIEFLKEL